LDDNHFSSVVRSFVVVSLSRFFTYETNGGSRGGRMVVGSTGTYAISSCNH